MNKSSLSPNIATRWFEIVSKRYGEPQRHYHTLDHIEELLLLSQKHASLLRSQENVEFSIWFHEYGVSLLLLDSRHSVIYDPTKADNEERSVDCWREFAEEAQLV